MTKQDDSFATAIFGVVDLSAMSFTYVRAGHPPPLLSRNRKVTPCGSPNQALGLFPDGEFIADKIDLELGDRLLAYTDGAIEIINSDGEELGTDGLTKLIAQNQKNSCGMDFINNLEKSLLEYSSQMTFNDDLTIAEIIINNK